MMVGLLGPFEITAGDGGPVELPGRKPRVLAAVLACHANRWVSSGVLVEALWGSSPPQRVDVSLRVYVHHLRKALGSERIGRRPEGYILRLDPDELDADRFAALVEAGRRAAGTGERERAAELLDAALRLWRGPALAGLESVPALAVDAARLEELRLQALEQRFEVELALGRYEWIVSELRALTGRHPLRETLRGQLMRALFGAGRGAEAIEEYDGLRHRLADELGLDPSAPLRDLYLSMLQDDPPPRPPSGPLRVPALLPPDVVPFVGRQAELDRLDALLAEAGRRPTATMILAVSGGAGMGKTALAVHWAHRAADRFPDGRLYVDLRGYHPGPPMRPADALAGFLRALGLPDQDIPAGIDDLTARYRTELAGRRLLVVLDNAADVEQARPLLPGAPGCAVIVTSRDDLAGLVAVHGAERIAVGPLPGDEAHALLRRLIGPRVAAEPAAATALADGCARLPLALRVAAELAASRPALPLTDLVGEFADHQQRLDLLDAGGDPRADVRAVFSWSLKHLPPDAARAFRRVGLHPGTDADLHALAALMAAGPAEARRTLSRLTRAHLVQPTAHGRYRMHDLLRAYAISLAAEDVRDATGRLLDHYLAAAAAAMDRLHPAEARTRPRVPTPATAVPAFANRSAARDWLDTERPNLVTAVLHAAEHDRPEHVFRLSRLLFRYLRGGHHADALTIHDRARVLARRLADPAEEAHALIGLGSARLRTADYASATESFERALDLFRDTADTRGEATALYSLGVVRHRGLSRYGEARQYLQQALTRFRAAGDQTGEAFVLNNLGIIERRLGHLESAADYQQQTVALAQKIGDDGTEAYALNSLGLVEEQLGRYDCAMDHLTAALRLFREAGDRCGEASALDNIGAVHTRLARHEDAQECFTQALTILREIRNRDGEAWALNSIGESARAAGHPSAAHVHHAEALTVATEIGALDQQARAHAGLGQTHRTLDRPGEARAHLEQALRLYVELDSPDADPVRAQLATLPR